MEKAFLNNKNVNLLFDKSWLNKKSLLTKYLKDKLPINIINIFRNIKNTISNEK